jgi:hypothetical protein
VCACVHVHTRVVLFRLFIAVGSLLIHHSRTALAISLVKVKTVPVSHIAQRDAHPESSLVQDLRLPWRLGFIL